MERASYQAHHNLYHSTNIVRVKSRNLRWADHVARMAGSRNAKKFRLESLWIKDL